MGWSRYTDQLEEPEQGAKEDEADELIEGSPVMKRLGRGGELPPAPRRLTATW